MEQISITEEEYRLLRKVFESASDYTLGKLNPEFCKANGGMGCLEDIMIAQVCKCADWYEGNYG